MPTKTTQNKKTINVLYLTINPNRESTTRPTEGWIKYLAPKGLFSVVVTDARGDFNKWLEEQGVPAYDTPLLFSEKTKLFTFCKTLCRLIYITKKHGTELIHCNEQNVYPIGQYLSRICKIPIVVTAQFTLKRDFCEWAFKGVRCPQRVFFTSYGNLENCREAVKDIIPEEIWRVSYNAIDTQIFHPDLALREQTRQQYSLKKEITIGAACALRPVKQLEHLFEVAAHIQMPKTKVLIAGFSVPGYERYAEDLLKEAKDKLGDRFVFLGKLGITELTGFYNALDVFVNTSKEEGFSLSILSAMACGCPIVGYPSKETVSEAVLPDGGEIVEQDNVKALQEKLVELLNDPTRLKDVRTKASERGRCFDIQKVADKLLDEYRDVLNK